jgi:hypothetical protein
VPRADGGPEASRQAAELMALLGLSEEELCQTLAVDPLTLLSGQLEHRPELQILTAQLREASEQAGSGLLKRWVRAKGPSGRPVELLLRRDFAGFEDALAELSERGFVLRGGT